MFLVLLLLYMLKTGVLNSIGIKLGLIEINTYTLIFEQGFVAPDNFVQRGILINGNFPGPTIRIKPHTQLNINVINKLPTGFALHYHGIHQVGTISSDGAPGVTQFNIPPNGTYNYFINIGNQTGSFIYHAHTTLDQNWAMGALIIEDHHIKKDPRYAYDYEEVFLLSQCWHTPLENITQGLLGTPFQDVPDTDSLLINGRSYGRGENKSGLGYDVINVKSNSTYRFRVLSLAVDSMLTYSISNHTLTIIEMDGIITEPVESNHLELNAAQRYSVLVKMDQPIGNYWIQTEMIPGPGPRNGRAILHYEGAPDPTSHQFEIFDGETEEVELNQWIQDELFPSTTITQDEIYEIPQSFDKEIVIDSHEVNTIDGRTRFKVNGHIFTDYDPPVLHQIRNGVNFSNKEPSVYEIIVGESIQIVFVNRVGDDGECEQHPWHFHGHTVYVVGQGADDYDPESDKLIIDNNIKRNKNQFRDVITLFPNQKIKNNKTGVGCGWIAVRFRVNNPGIWMVHCHLTPHMLMGKLFLLYEHTKEDPKLNLIK